MRFSEIENPTVQFGAVLIIGNFTVRFGAVFRYCKSYGAVRCGFQKSVILRYGSVRLSNIVNPRTVRLGAVIYRTVRFGAVPR